MNVNRKLISFYIKDVRFDDDDDDYDDLGFVDCRVRVVAFRLAIILAVDY